MYDRKIPLTVSLLLLLVIDALGQATLNGKISDSTGKPIPFANILLLSVADSTLYKGTVATENGNYQLTGISAGSYFLSLRMIGYKEKYKNPLKISGDDTFIELGTDVLEEDVQQLGEVVVTASKPLFEQQLDRLVVNVQSSIATAGASALEVLERSPGISLNRQNNSLSMNGRDGVVVMINGKVSRLPLAAVVQMLSGMNAGNVEKIELISTPSASYDAEGNAGVINIVLKKGTAIGTNGNFSLTMGYGWYERPAASLHLNHRRQKFNVFAEGSFLWDHYWFSTYTHRSINNPDLLQKSSNISNRHTHHLTYDARMGFEYAAGAKTILSAMMAGFNNRQEQFARNNSEYYKSGRLNTTIGVKDHEINQWRHLMGNLNLQHSFNNREQLSLDLDYLFYQQNNPHWYINNFLYLENNDEVLEKLNSDKITPLHLWVGKIDYSKNIRESSKLEGGVKATFSWLNNDVLLEKLDGEVWRQEAEFSENLQMIEDIFAVYSNFQHSFDANTSLQTGLRWEYTHTDLSSSTGENIVKRKFHYLFPSISVSRNFNTLNSLQFSYSRRITRPTYIDLAPVFTFVDPYTSITGNTSLMPAITNSLQAAYQFRKQYMLSIQYSHDANAINWMMRVDPEQNKQYTYKDNTRSVDTYSLNLNIPLTITSWWEMQNNLMGNWQKNKTHYLGEPIEVSGYSAQVNTVHTFKLPKNFLFEVSGLYKAPSFWGILVFSSYGSVNAGLQKKLKEDKGTLRLSVTDLFWNMRFEAVNNLPDMNFNQQIGFLFEPRVVRLTYSRNFGNEHVKGANKRRTGSEEERSRVRN